MGVRSYGARVSAHTVTLLHKYLLMKGDKESEQTLLEYLLEGMHTDIIPEALLERAYEEYKNLIEKKKNRRFLREGEEMIKYLESNLAHLRVRCIQSKNPRLRMKAVFSS
jgi:hypothetical protein